MEYVFIPNLSHTFLYPGLFTSVVKQNVNVVKLKLNVQVMRSLPMSY